jgi:mitochondrial cardiolipin hydrolase
MRHFRRAEGVELLSSPIKVDQKMTSLLAERTTMVETVFSREASIAETIQRLIQETRLSIDAAVHRLNSGELFECLLEAEYRGIEVRLLTDWSKYQQSEFTRKLLGHASFPWKLSRGRNDSNSKMHHKFLILDQSLVLTGSYNWTLASETQNFENIVILREPESVTNFRAEFDALWEDGACCPGSARCEASRAT